MRKLDQVPFFRVCAFNVFPSENAGDKNIFMGLGFCRKDKKNIRKENGVKTEKAKDRKKTEKMK